MRSLRSGRKADINKEKSENTNSKMCNKRSKPNKTDSQKARPVLADRTNSDMDTNSSSNTSAFSIIARPKRTHNLPAKFQDHEITPIKSYRPECSSTPLPAKIKTNKNTPVNSRARSRHLKTNVKGDPVKPDKVDNLKKSDALSKINSNKAGKQNQSSEESKTLKTTAPIYNKDLKEPQSAARKSLEAEKVLTPLYKKKVALLEKPKIQTPDRMALYEFDFDPSEEQTQAQPAGKKKRIRKKAPPSKKKAKINSDKDDADLQNLIEKLKKIQEKQKCKKLLEKRKALKKADEATNIIPTINIESVPAVIDNETHSPIGDEQNIECLSPIPMSSKTSSPLIRRQSILRQQKSDRLSDSPIASSSMINRSVPNASPWRVEGAVGVRKWPLNFHVKPSMTPSYDRDTVHVIGLSQREQNSVPNERSHIYTNISINTSHGEEDSNKRNTNWKQTSILSFYEESLKKSAKKRSLPTKKPVESYNFDELVPERNELSNTLNESEQIADQSSDQDKNKGTVENCFGFDDSAEFDQENMSPTKVPRLQNINTIRGRFKGTRKPGAALKEIQTDDKNLPMRVMPSDIIQIIEKQKFMEDIEEPREEPTLSEIPDLNYDSDKSSNDDDMIGDNETPLQGTSHSNEMELFAEPIEPEFVHFSKSTRRSYETRKRPQLTFLLPDMTKCTGDKSDNDSDDDHVYVEKVKKVTKRKKKQNTKTKKEEKKIDEWAAGFNSMLEEVEDFALCVE